MRALRLLLALLLATIAAGATAAQAAAPRIALSPGTVHRGDAVRVHGTIGGCAVGDQVALISRAFGHQHEFAGIPAVYAQVKHGGVYSISTSVPKRLKPGRYSVSGRCGGGNLGVTVTLVVLR